MVSMDASGDIAMAAPARRARDILPLEFSFLVRPTGRLMLAGQVPSLEPFLALPPDTRLWLRFVAPDRHDAAIEIASTSGEAPPSTARALARGAVLDRWGAWALLRVAQAQGVVDVMLAGTEPPDGAAAPTLHLLAGVDLSAGRDAPDQSLGADASLPTICRPDRYPPRSNCT